MLNKHRRSYIGLLDIFVEYVTDLKEKNIGGIRKQGDSNRQLKTHTYLHLGMHFLVLQTSTSPMNHSHKTHPPPRDKKKKIRKKDHIFKIRMHHSNK